MLETLVESNVDIIFEQNNQATITVVKAGYSGYSVKPPWSKTESTE